jgi:phosphatidylserine decarboxylase
MVKEGYWYGLPLVLLAGGLGGLKLYVPALVAVVLAALVLNFFRDPERLIPTDSACLVSPADGRTQEVVEEEFGGRRWQRVSIFMSPLDVHVNRSPLEGAIAAVEYRKGSFHPAMRPEVSLENEQNVVTIRGERTTVVVRQIAGLLARRIVFWKRRGDTVRKGERFGLIKFGSRVDVLLEPGIRILVKPGDRVRAGSSVLAIHDP